MKSIKFIFLYSVLITPYVALAQFPGNGNWIPGSAPTAGSSTVGGVELNGYYNDLIGSEFQDSPSDPSNEFFGFTQTDNLTMPIATIHLNPRNACTGFQCAGNENYIAPGERKIPLSAMLPGALSAQTDYMRSQNIASNSQANLNTASVVWNTSMFLAEPAVAQGEHNAFMKAAAMAQTGFLEQLNFATIANNLQGAKPAFDAYTWCIQNKLQEGIGWAKARMVCGSDQGSGNIQSTIPASTAEAAIGFSYYHTPGLDITNLNNMDLRQTKLSDLIFNQEALSNSLYASQLRNFRDAFRETYGDIEFALSAPTGSGLVRTHSHKIIPPTRSPAKLFLSLVVYKFNALRGIVFKYCRQLDSPGSGSGSATTGEIYWPVSSSLPLGGSYAGSAITKDDLKAISVPGFTMTAGAVTNLRSWYKELFTAINAAGQQKINCDPLKNDDNFEVGDVFGIEPPFKKFSDHINLLEGREYFISLYQFARLLALGEWLTKAATMEQIIESLSAGIANSETYENMAKDLIYRAVGSRDLRPELERTSANLRSQFINIYERSVVAAEASAQKASNMPR